jgi:hypothetical protein
MGSPRPRLISPHINRSSVAPIHTVAEALEEVVASGTLAVVLDLPPREHLTGSVADEICGRWAGRTTRSSPRCRERRDARVQAHEFLLDPQDAEEERVHRLGVAADQIFARGDETER